MRFFFLLLAGLLLNGCEPARYFGASEAMETYDRAALKPLGTPQDADAIRKLILDKDDDFRGITIHWVSADEVVVFATKQNPYNHYYCALKRKGGRWRCDMIYEAMVD
jgi:hypothetical protein